MNNKERRDLILRTAMSDLQFADDTLAYTDIATDGMVMKLNKMKKPELEALLEKAKESKYFEEEE